MTDPVNYLGDGHHLTDAGHSCHVEMLDLSLVPPLTSGGPSHFSGAPYLQVPW